LPETWDNGLDAQIHRQYAEILTKRQYFDFRSQPYFSPSSANSSKRELYVKVRGAKKDVEQRPAYQGRWTRLGTLVGDMIQRDLLFIEKHYENKTQKLPSFVPQRTDEGYPLWEDFAKTMKVIEHNGVKFSLFGTPDGILHHRSGKRVGLEIKSKQTTAAQTSLYSMREPKEDHVKQTIAYSIMYGVDDYIIAYVNGAKKGWVMSDEDFEKNPDIRAFHIEITERDRQALLDDFAEVVKAAQDGNPPPLDLDKWTFNSYKTACALDLSDEEFDELKSQVRAVMKSGMPRWKKSQYFDALEYIREVREAV
jgi:CRISPR/Cas system-associated exonuclease Cas4 (RecB family)